MSVEDDLLNEIKKTLGKTITPSLCTKSASSDLYEAYALSLVIEAAKREGATVQYRDPDDNPTSNFVFRTSPGYLWSKTHLYTFAFIQFPNVEPLEAHVGVRVSGKSGVLHEFDVCVLNGSEGQYSRSNHFHPRSPKMLIGIECKFYSSGLSLGLGRQFIGLGADVTAKRTYFVTNQSSASVEKLLSARGRKWGNQVQPGSAVSVERIKNEFQTAFKDYIASS